MTKEILQRRSDYLFARLRKGQGNVNVLVNEIVKTFNARQDRRRHTDTLIRGWAVVEGSAL